MRTILITAVLTVAAFLRSPGQIPSDRDALLNGDGAGMALYAELNGYPGPKHVLELEKQLALTPDQKRQVREIYEEMETRARSLGRMIVKVEEELHTAFSSGMIGVESVEDDAEQAGKLRGILRGVHLAAHLKTKDILTADQLKTYVRLRGELREKKTGGSGHGETEHRR